MNWQRIQTLLANASPQPGTSSIPAEIPSEYAEVLGKVNGAEGFVGSGDYLVLWPADELKAMNDDYCVNEYAPSIYLIGTNGGGEGYGILKDGRYGRVPLVGMADEDVIVLGATFEEFLEALAAATD